MVTEPSPQPALRSACQYEMAQPSPRGAQSRCDPKGVLRSACWVGTPCWNFSSSVSTAAEAGLGKGLCGSDRDPGLGQAALPAVGGGAGVFWLLHDE